MEDIDSLRYRRIRRQSRCPAPPVMGKAGKPRRPWLDSGTCLLHTTNTEVLQFEVVIDAVLRAFAAQTAFFHTTKWRHFR